MKFNKLILGGHLTRDPEVRALSSGKNVTAFGLAVNGFKEGDVLFIDCDAWGKAGEVIAARLRKGDPGLFEGRLSYRSWEDKDGGGKRSKFSMTVEGFSFAGAPKQRADGKGEGPPVGDDDVPF